MAEAAGSTSEVAAATQVAAGELAVVAGELRALVGGAGEAGAEPPSRPTPAGAAPVPAWS